MNKVRKFQKPIAIAFLFFFLPSVFPINKLYAANNGPVAPEATAFEPVDAADMVNLLTGDAAYSMPILNVPSPEGGYPLALSNHSGIALDQEASWVGLGWSLNPGAINRTVTGIPDDWKNTNVHQIIYDAGGEQKSFSGSVSVGFQNNTFSVGLYGSYTENKTFGGSISHRGDGGVQASIGSGNYGFNARLGTDGVGVGVGVNVGSRVSAGIGVNQSFKDGSTSVSAGVSEKPGNDMVGASNTGVGISFSSKSGLSGSIAGQGFRLAGNSLSAGKLNVSTQSYNVSVQIYFVNIGLGFSKARYWTYQNNFTKYNGSLYPGDFSTLYNSYNFPSRMAFDSYNSIYKLDSDEQLEDDNLSFVGYDNYAVSGQGISGSMKPGIFQQGSIIQNFKDVSVNDHLVSYVNGNNNQFTKNVNNNADDIHFYFDNELSSYLRNTSSNWLTPPQNINPANLTNTTTLNSQTTIQETMYDGAHSVTYNGYKAATKRKRTGNFVEAFTNKELDTAWVIKAENYQKPTNLDEAIGAFRITSVDGKVYHYSIPVYEYEEFSKTTDLKSEFEYRYFEKQQLKPYATHWLLTAITGPDYIDMNNNKMVDDGDYGYWTAFDYGKWSDGYPWMTPTKKNDKVKAYEWGVKDVYYLDKVRTRTHTAVFVKELRSDDMGYERLDTGTKWRETVNRSFIRGKDGQLYFYGIYDNPTFSVPNLDLYDIPHSWYGEYVNFRKHRSLRLNKILLFKNGDLNISKTAAPSGQTPYNGQIRMDEKFQVIRVGGQVRANAQAMTHQRIWTGERFNQVYDLSDVTPAIEQKALKTIKFGYNYQLAQNSPSSQATGKGRLTLESVSFMGRNNSAILPPYRFGYVNTKSYDPEKEDNWGYYSAKPDEWSLTKVTTPLGSDINILYEADDIDKEAVPSKRGFDGNVQFSFSYDSNYVYGVIANESGNAAPSINFTDFFEVGNVKMDLWASLKHDYQKAFKGCKARKGSVDIMPYDAVQITSVSPQFVTFKTSISHAYDSNGGLGWMCNKAIGLDYHPSMIRVDQKRNTFGEPPGCVNVTDRLVLLYKLYGNKSAQLASDKVGGGLRVKEVNVTEAGVKKNIAKYFYNVPGYGENKTDSNYKSSGITSFVPHKYFKEVKHMSELPAPMVMYEYVTVKSFSTDNQLGAAEQYNFEVLKADTSTDENQLNMPGSLQISKIQSNSYSNLTSGAEAPNVTYKLGYSRFEIKDYLANVGRLKSRKVINAKNQVLQQEEYAYRAPSTINQGITEESFNTYKRVRKSNTDITYRLGVTNRITYPSMAEMYINTQGGYTSKTYYDNYDFLTGQLTDSRFESGDGKTFMSKVTPAYRKYAEMGSKSDNLSYRNMLSQGASDYSYIYDPTNQCQNCQPSNLNYWWKEIDASITTWNNEWTYRNPNGTNETAVIPNNKKAWRAQHTYRWNGVKDSDGIFSSFDSATDDGFQWAVGVGQPLNSEWKLLSETTLYNHFSAALETKDLNGNYMSSKLGDGQSKTSSSGNAAYNEMFFTGGEYETSGQLDPEIELAGGATRTTVKFHSGRYSMLAASGQKIQMLLKDQKHRATRYKLSVWVQESGASNARVSIGNQTAVAFNGEEYKAGEWILKTHYFDATSGDNLVYVTSQGAGIYYDDIMLRPAACSISGYVYDQYDQLTYIIGNSGLGTKFEYDDAGRLVKTYMEVIEGNGIAPGQSGFKLKTENKIKYKNL